MAHAYIGGPVKLQQMSSGKHSEFSTYEPELFPGLIYRMLKPKVTFLVFASGKMVITGALKEEDIFEAFNNLKPVLL